MTTNPYEQRLTPYEQKLRDEVIYLHSLWHRGPPTFSTNLNRLGRIPIHISNNFSSRNLHVSHSTSFKKTKGKKHLYQNSINSNASGSGSTRQPDPGPEWPVNPTPASSSPNSTSGWPSFKVKLSPSNQIVQEIDEAKIATMQMQQKVVKSCNEFFSKKVDLDSEVDDDLEEEDEGDDSLSDDSDVEETDEFKFFFSLFVENRELRDFYENNLETGDFYCLVCGGMGVKVGKTFKGCLGLVQHAIAILRTKRIRAHRALGQVICRVIGWDFSRLPMIVLKREPLSQSLANNCLKEDGNKKMEDLDDGVSDIEASKGGELKHEECSGTNKSGAGDAETSLKEVDIGTKMYNTLGENSGVYDVQIGLIQ